MAQIVDICFIKGRRRQAIEEEKANIGFTTEATLRKFAKYVYNDYVKKQKKEFREVKNFETWATSYENEYEHIRSLVNKDIQEQKFRDKWISYGEKLQEKKVEISLEQQILDLLNDGWVLKGEIIGADNQWVQTMIKYKSNNNEDLLGLQSTESEKNTFIPEGSEEENEDEDEDEDEEEDGDK